MREWVTICIAGMVGGVANVMLALLARRTAHGRVFLPEDRPTGTGRLSTTVWIVDNAVTIGCTLGAGVVAAFVFWCLNSSGVNFDSTQAIPSRVAGAVIAGLGGARLLNQYADTTLRRDRRQLEEANRGLSAIAGGLVAEVKELAATSPDGGMEDQSDADA